MTAAARTITLEVGKAEHFEQVLDVKTLALGAKHHKIDDQQLICTIVSRLNHRVIVLVQLETKRGQIDQYLFESDVISAKLIRKIFLLGLLSVFLAPV